MEFRGTLLVPINYSEWKHSNNEYIPVEGPIYTKINLNNTNLLLFESIPDKEVPILVYKQNIINFIESDKTKSYHFTENTPLIVVLARYLQSIPIFYNKCRDYRVGYDSTKYSVIKSNLYFKYKSNKQRLQDFTINILKKKGDIKNLKEYLTQINLFKH